MKANSAAECSERPRSGIRLVTMRWRDNAVAHTEHTLASPSRVFLGLRVIAVTATGEEKKKTTNRHRCPSYKSLLLGSVAAGDSSHRNDTPTSRIAPTFLLHNRMHQCKVLCERARALHICIGRCATLQCIAF